MKRIKKIWRKRVNKELKDEEKIFDLIDTNIFLKVQVLNMYLNGDYYKKKLKLSSKEKE